MSNKSKKILSEISAGELLDKISILEIKLDKIKNKNSRDEIDKEYKMLKKTQNSKFDYLTIMNVLEGDDRTVVLRIARSTFLGYFEDLPFSIINLPCNPLKPFLLYNCSFLNSKLLLYQQ